MVSPSVSMMSDECATMRYGLRNVSERAVDMNDGGWNDWEV
jgi:hypothetical protein